MRRMGLSPSLLRYRRWTGLSPSLLLYMRRTGLSPSLLRYMRRTGLSPSLLWYRRRTGLSPSLLRYMRRCIQSFEMYSLEGRRHLGSLLFMEIKPTRGVGGVGRGGNIALRCQFRGVRVHCSEGWVINGLRKRNNKEIKY